MLASIELCVINGTQGGTLKLVWGCSEAFSLNLQVSFVLQSSIITLLEENSKWCSISEFFVKTRLINVCHRRERPLGELLAIYQ